MIIIHDKRLPEEAIQNLQKYGDCLPFYSENITYKEIAGHPDIFFLPTEKFVIVAPNTPQHYIDYLKKQNVTLIIGQNSVGNKKEDSTCYNAVVSDNYIIHNKNFTDQSIFQNIKEKEFIQVNQAYTRCSLLPLKNDCFITSDRGIEKELLNNKLTCLYVSPKEIELPGFPYGFIGGCMGIFEDKVFIIGNLDFHPEGKKIEAFLHENDYQIISLYDGKLFDGGSIFFINNFYNPRFSFRTSMNSTLQL
ncbi:hypothetical protein LJC25_05255 [Bacteroidales bacterium OttesenSCG-928-K03]|nr:hypothetical protein [Odoribacter sp. OttesenSCG-928-L07]MDL2238989.1 hypothetical protein [Bacteroidales bacterium OttesenSCG-928-L14]MDL2240723.1 hypothetical protein [Bacteroidales bacterium OttesenSCG-928-K22]MDL2243115.1 hypothetical protein [Bacteroidales bacterium OttesenSCG-928-K03]